MGILISKNYKFVNEFLEKNYHENLTLEEGLKLIGQALANNIDNPKKNSDFTVISAQGIKILSEAEIEQLFSGIEANE